MKFIQPHNKLTLCLPAYYWADKAYKYLPYLKLSIIENKYDEKDLYDERLGAKLRVIESMRPLNSLTYVYLALLPQYWALYAKVDSTPTFIYVYIYFFFIKMITIIVIHPIEEYLAF